MCVDGIFQFPLDSMNFPSLFFNFLKENATLFKENGSNLHTKRALVRPSHRPALLNSLIEFKLNGTAPSAFLFPVRGEGIQMLSWCRRQWCWPPVNRAELAQRFVSHAPTNIRRRCSDKTPRTVRLRQVAAPS